METHHSDPLLTQQISVIREFNRFYTAKLGLLRRRHLDGEFSLTEARILYEIGANPGVTASILRASLAQDAGYISRLLSSLTQRKLVHRAVSSADGREKPLNLTLTGARAAARLNQQSSAQINDILISMDAPDRETLVASLAKARDSGRAQTSRKDRAS